jgi:ArsR family transcriptional regulator
MLLLKEKPLTAGEIAGNFDMTAATVSHHLSVLKESGLVSAKKEGKYIFYEADPTVISEMIGFLAQLIGR